MKMVPNGMIRSTLAIVTFLSMALLTQPSRAAEGSYKAKGLYLEGCSCGIPCACDMMGPEKGCEGVGVVVLRSGKYDGKKLAGAKIAVALVPGKWVRLYIDAKDPEQFKAAEGFVRAAFKDSGSPASVKKASVKLTGQDGNYELSVDDGKIMTLKTEPVLGADNKTPFSHGNLHNPLAPMLYQARTVSGTFNDEGHSFTLKDSNSFFNAKFSAKGSG